WEIFMLRNSSSADARRHGPGSAPAQNRRLARFGGVASASFLAFAAASAVNAESLAQPRDNALERAAADYVAFRDDIAAIEAVPFTSPETTREAHRRLSAHNDEALATGWVAYAALVAADAPDFKEALQKEVNNRKNRHGKLKGADAFFAKLAEDPGYPRTLPGADDAIKRVLSMTSQDMTRVITLGEAFKSQAYAMQKTSWGKQKIPSASTRLSDAASYARQRPAATAPALAAVTEKGVTAPSLASATSSWDPDWGAKASAGKMTEPNAQIVMNRVLNLAARYAVSGVNEKTVAAYAKNNKSSQCLSMATLTLKQCIAATRAPYEEAFCLGEHGLNDVATCVGWVAGVDAD
ncbi:MAG: hypothetical protein KDA46_05665, partial [Parvularculaceae bacterium]|nr:hypothetical protein [Parvularculaceae bacterium]